MIPSQFDYHRPKTLRKAVSLLNEHEGAKVLAGGHSLIPLLKLRFADVPTVIDIGRVGGLKRIRVADGQIRIGALATHYTIESNARLRRICGLLTETAHEIGDPQIRNVGTIGGSVVHADPAADWPAAMFALGASFEIAGSNGTRNVSAADFFVDMLTTSIGEGEILSHVVLPVPAEGSGGAYEKMHQSASGFAVAGVAAQISLDGGKIANAGIGVTGIATTPYRASVVEDALTGQAADASTVSAAAAHIADDVEDLNEDHHASGDYRRHLAGVFAERAILRAVERAGG